MSVISLPERDQIVRRAVDAGWSYLEAVETIEDLRYELRKAAVKAALENITDDEAFAEIQARRFGVPPTDKKVKVAELETLISAQEEVGEDRPEGVFFARSLPRYAWDKPWMAPIERVVRPYSRPLVARSPHTRVRPPHADVQFAFRIGCGGLEPREPDLRNDLAQSMHQNRLASQYVLSQR